MKTPKATLALFLLPLLAGGQNGAPAPEEMDLSDAVVIESAPTAETPAEADAGADVIPSDGDQPVVVEIPEQPVEGATFEAPAPDLPDVAVALPGDADVVLELPGQERGGGEATIAEEDTIQVDFPDEDVRTILRNVADLFDLNLVIPDTLQGRTSIQLKGVTWRQVFEVVLEPLGFTYIEDRNIIRIKNIEELTTEPVDTRVFVVNYARANELQGSIAPLVDSALGGRIQVDTRSNALVITERPSQMNKIQEIIERLDKATNQVMIESKFIEVSKDDVQNIGVNWTSLSGYGVTAGPFQRSYEQERSREDGSGNSGSEEFLFDSGSGSTTTINDSVSDTFSRLASTTRTDTAVFSADQFEVILSALETASDIKLVSNPTVVTLDNKEAKIAIGEKYPIPSYTFNAETGQRQLDEIEYEDIGITLDVTPQVNSAGFINLSIIPEVSSRLGFAIVENTEIPIIASRRTETNIMIKDGFTLAIGGLVENTTRKDETKVPLLGDLPGVGRLFKSDTDSVQQRNLIIFITARTLNPDGSTYRDIIDPRVLDEMEVLPSELPGYRIPQDQMDELERLEGIRIEKHEAERAAQTRARIKAYEYQKMQEAEEAKSAR